MKILLVSINAKYIHSNLALLDLKAYAGKYAVRRSDMDIEIAEYTINHQTDDILTDIYRRKPDLIAFSCYIWNIEIIYDLAADIGSILPDVDLWLGGPEVSFDAEKVLEAHPYITGVMRGEGEETFCELADYYCMKLNPSGLPLSDEMAVDLKNILGITFRVPVDNHLVDGHSSGTRLAGCASKKYSIVSTPSRGPIDMNRIPFPYSDMSVFRNRIIYYETSRGCPFGCAYCLSSVDRKVRFRDFGIVQGELDFFLANKVPQVKFVDRTFNCNRKHALAIWKYVAKHDNGITNFHFEISADLLQNEELELFSTMRPGLIQLEIGVQSTNMDTIHQIDRTMDLDELKETVARVHSGGNINQHLDLIAGLPGEDYESFRNSFKEVYAMAPEQLQLGFLKVLKGSPLFARTGEYGIGYKNKAPYEVLYTKWLPYEDVLRLKVIEEMTEVYYNSRQFVHTLDVLSAEYDNPFDLFGELGDYYEKCGLNQVNHSRIRRYDILLDFIRAKWPGDEVRERMYRELMTYDLYLREKVKSRPAWAENPALRRAETVAFYREEERTHYYLPEDPYGEYNSRQLESMTALEYFTYPVTESEKLGRNMSRSRLSERCRILFDYRNRNQMTGDARNIMIKGTGKEYAE